MASHDNGYKLLFSHASVVADVLRGFVKEDWVREVDFESLERVEGSYVSDKLRARESDMLWKVRWRGRSLYVYVLLEFQSRVDRFMAVRVMGYLALLYQDLIRQRAFAPSGKLPPVFLLVLYNGKRRWRAALDVADLIEPVPGGLEVYRPRLRYALLDEAQVPELELESERNVAAALFRLEKSRDVESLRREVSRIAAAPGLDEGLRRSVHTWLTQVLLPGRFPEWSPTEARSLEEVDTMLAERVKEWTREWKKEGMQEGLQKGLEKGLRQGRREGRAEGLQELLLSQMEERFGPVPKTIRRRVESIRDFEELKKLGKRLLAAASLEDLGL
jgi:flagellar biosynthesis/type III secretory pathway protein FliH